MRKLLAFAVLAYCAWRLLRHLVRLRYNEIRGIKPPERTGPRPADVLAIALIVIYGGYLIWYLARHLWPAS